MKKLIILTVATFMVSSTIFAQKNAVSEVKIKTSAQCDMCKTRIENGLYTQKGVVQAVLDVPSKVVTIKYRAKKITEEKLRIYISSLGYDADEVIADQTAHDQLPGCCQKGSGGH